MLREYRVSSGILYTIYTHEINKTTTVNRQSWVAGPLRVRSTVQSMGEHTPALIASGAIAPLVDYLLEQHENESDFIELVNLFWKEFLENSEIP